MHGVLFANCTSVHKPTGLTPIELMFCRYVDFIQGEYAVLPMRMN